MVALEEEMKKHNISIDSTSFNSSHGHALSAYVFSFNTTSTSTSDEWLIDSGAVVGGKSLLRTRTKGFIIHIEMT
jgi:hypothetical protein